MFCEFIRLSGFTLRSRFLDTPSGPTLKGDTSTRRRRGSRGRLEKGRKKGGTNETEISIRSSMDRESTYAPTSKGAFGVDERTICFVLCFCGGDPQADSSLRCGCSRVYVPSLLGYLFDLKVSFAAFPLFEIRRDQIPTATATARMRGGQHDGWPFNEMIGTW